MWYAYNLYNSIFTNRFYDQWSIPWNNVCFYFPRSVWCWQRVAAALRPLKPNLRPMDFKQKEMKEDLVRWRNPFWSNIFWFRILSFCFEKIMIDRRVWPLKCSGCIYIFFDLRMRHRPCINLILIWLSPLQLQHATMLLSPTFLQKVLRKKNRWRWRFHGNPWAGPFARTFKGCSYIYDIDNDIPYPPCLVLISHMFWFQDNVFGIYTWESTN